MACASDPRPLWRKSTPETRSVSMHGRVKKLLLQYDVPFKREKGFSICAVGAWASAPQLCVVNDKVFTQAT